MRKKLIYTPLVIAALTACSSSPQKIKSPLFESPSPSAERSEKILIPQEQTFLSLNIEEHKSAGQAKPLQTTDTPEYIIYTAHGGEQLSFVARSLLGTPTKTTLLKSWNPEIPSKELTPGAQIRVQREALQPQSIYLSRDLLKKYAPQLSEALTKKTPLQKYQVQAHETLQSISMKLYKTSRRWTEIYLLNYKTLQNPDALEVHTELWVF